MVGRGKSRGAQVGETVVLGLGNILLRDEGVGVHVLRELEARYAFDERARLVDGGTGGLRLLRHIVGADHLIVIDAVQGGQSPGCLYRITPDDLEDGLPPRASLHEMGLVAVLRIAETLSRRPSTVILGVEPQDISSWGVELTPALAKQSTALVQMVLEELTRLGVVFVEK